jgi:site-specific DNA-cytosine methylase
MKKLRVIDFFCGTGGISERLKLTGFEITLHFEMNNNVYNF